MSQVQASDVKKLRDHTGAGFADCKAALVSAEGDFEKALRHIKEQGKSKAHKKSDRVAANGVVLAYHGSEGAALLEVNCETDFVARNETFQDFTQALIEYVYAHRISDIDALAASVWKEGQTVEQARFDLVMSIGENIQLRRCIFVEKTQQHCVSYQHGQRIGAIVVMEGGDDELAEQIAMQIAASPIIALDRSGIPEDVLASERSVAEVRVAQMGKPESVAASIVEGMVAKFIDSQTLGGQPFILDNSKRVDEILRSKQAKVLHYVRYILGEGIEVVKENFADAVRAIQEQAG